MLFWKKFAEINFFSIFYEIFKTAKIKGGGNFPHFWLLKNPWRDFNKILQEVSTQDPSLKFFNLTRSTQEWTQGGPKVSPGVPLCRSLLPQNRCMKWKTNCIWVIYIDLWLKFVNSVDSHICKIPIVFRWALWPMGLLFNIHSSVQWGPHVSGGTPCLCNQMHFFLHIE